jgi:predicted porin
MQKKLMAVAVAGALVAPALAFAQSSTVQIYGAATFEYGYVDQGDGKNKTDMLQTPGGTSIGFKGVEKLGGGLSAWFQCESSADVRGESAAGFCTRNSALGFKGGFGNVFIGKWDTPFKQAYNAGRKGGEDTGLLGTAFLMAGSSTAGNTSTLAGVARNVWKRREHNSINYTSPKFGGFSVGAAYSTGNSATAGTDVTVSAKPRVMSVAANYKAGKLTAAVGYELHKQFGAAGTRELDDKAFVIAASYKLGKVDIGAAYNEQQYEIGAGSELKKKAWMIGADWSLAGPHSVGANYTQADSTKGSGLAPAAINASTVPFNAAGNTGANLFQIYYGHKFSKRTTAKLGYVRLDNDLNAAYTLGGVKTSAVAANNKDQNALVLLLKHKF